MKMSRDNKKTLRNWWNDKSNGLKEILLPLITLMQNQFLQIWRGLGKLLERKNRKIYNVYRCITITETLYKISKKTLTNLFEK